MTTDRPPFTLYRTARKTYRVDARSGQILGYVMRVADGSWTATRRYPGETVRLGHFATAQAGAAALHLDDWARRDAEANAANVADGGNA